MLPVPCDHNLNMRPLDGQFATCKHKTLYCKTAILQTPSEYSQNFLLFAETLPLEPSAALKQGSKLQPPSGLSVKIPLQRSSIGTTLFSDLVSKSLNNQG